MKYIMVAYIGSEELLASIEGIAGYYGLDIIESNLHYRLFMGHCKKLPAAFSEALNKELADVQFDLDDSLSLIYTKQGARGELGNIVIKRKGNKGLRNHFIGN